LGQKINPTGLRIGIIENWKSRWFATKNYAELLAEDIKIREWTEKRLARAAILKVEIERAGDQLKIDIYTARPGIVIGKRGAEVDLLRAELEKIAGKRLQVNIQEVVRPEVNAALVAQGIAEQLTARVSFRRAMKKAVTAAMKSGVLGIKVACAGRLGGSEMSRSEWYREGRVPLHTLRARIDYGFTEAHTTFGRIGVKVWIYTGDVLTSHHLSSTTDKDKPGLGPLKRRSRGGANRERPKKAGAQSKSAPRSGGVKAGPAKKVKAKTETKAGAADAVPAQEVKKEKQPVKSDKGEKS